MLAPQPSFALRLPSSPVLSLPVLPSPSQPILLVPPVASSLQQAGLLYHQPPFASWDAQPGYLSLCSCPRFRWASFRCGGLLWSWRLGQSFKSLFLWPLGTSSSCCSYRRLLCRTSPYPSQLMRIDPSAHYNPNPPSNLQTGSSHRPCATRP